MTNEELCKLIQSGVDTQNNTETLWMQNQGIVRKVASSYARDQFEAEDLVQEAYFALLKAIDGYDFDCGVKFLTYYLIHLHSRMRRYLSKMRSSVSMAFNLADDVSRYLQYQKKLQMELGADPSDEMLCICLNVSQKKLNTIKKAAVDTEVLSLDHIPADEDQPLLDKIPDPDDKINDLIEDIAFRQLSEKLWQMVDELDPREQEILRGIYVQNRTGADIGRAMGVSQQRISEIKQRAFKKIKNQPEGKELKKMALDIYGFAVKGTSFSAFQRTWTSSTERAALKLIDKEED